MRNGFTLAEVLAVIVIVSLLLIISVPTVLNQVSNKESEVTEAEEEMIENAAALYIDNHPSLYSEGSTYYICVSTLIDSGELVDSFEDDTVTSKAVEVTINSNGTKTVNGLVSSSGC